MPLEIVQYQLDLLIGNFQDMLRCIFGFPADFLSMGSGKCAPVQVSLALFTHQTAEEEFVPATKLDSNRSISQIKTLLHLLQRVLICHFNGGVVNNAALGECLCECAVDITPRYTTWGRKEKAISSVAYVLPFEYPTEDLDVERCIIVDVANRPNL